MLMHPKYACINPNQVSIHPIQVYILHPIQVYILHFIQVCIHLIKVYIHLIEVKIQYTPTKFPCTRTKCAYTGTGYAPKICGVYSLSFLSAGLEVRQRQAAKTQNKPKDIRKDCCFHLLA